MLGDTASTGTERTVSLQSLYVHLLIDHSTTLDGDMQRRIVEHAKRHGDTDMLLVLLGRNDLTAEADTSIGESTDLPVLLTWMLRPGRNPGRIAERIEREKRIGILAVIATTDGLPKEVYANLAEHTSEKVLKALIAGTAADEETRRRAMRGLVAKAPRTVYSSTCSTALRDLVNGSGHARALWDEVGLHAVALPYLIAVNDYGNPTPAHLGRWADDLEEIHDFDGGRWADLTPMLVTGMLGRSLTREQHTRLLETTGAILADAEDPSARWFTELGHVRRLVKDYDIDTEELLHAFTEETDRDDATELLLRLRQVCRNAQAQRLLERATAHPNIALETLVDLRHDLNLAAVRMLAMRLEAAGRRDLLEFWLEDSVAGAHPPTFVSYLRNPQHLLGAHLQHLAENGRPWPAWALETREIHEDPAKALAHLPWNVLANSASSVPGLTAAVTKALTDILGEDDELWRTFEVLGADFEGTLTDLLLVVESLAP